MNYYERHIGDYLKDTSHLSLLEHGVYTRLLDVYYTRESGIPAGEAARLIGARSRDERSALASVLAEFFELIEGTYVQARADREIARFKDKQSKAKRSAKMRWSTQQTHSEGNANAMRTQSERSPNAVRTQCEGNAPRARPQSPVTSNHNPPLPPRGGGVSEFPPGFAEFWAAYPRKVGKDAAAKAFAKRRVGPELLAVMLAAIAAQRSGEQWAKDGGQFIPHPATWLNEGRWQDETSRVATFDAVFGAAL